MQHHSVSVSVEYYINSTGSRVRPRRDHHSCGFTADERVNLKEITWLLWTSVSWSEEVWEWESEWVSEWVSVCVSGWGYQIVLQCMILMEKYCKPLHSYMEKNLTGNLTCGNHTQAALLLSLQELNKCTSSRTYPRAELLEAERKIYQWCPTNAKPKEESSCC